MGLHQTKKLLHSEGKKPSTKRKSGLLNRRRYLQTIYPGSIERTQTIQHQKTNNPITKRAEDLNIFPKTYRCHWIHEKMLNLTNHQGNQNHNEISPHTCQNVYHQKKNK